MDWIISANPNIYDVQKAFSENERIDWRQTASQKVGDTVYIYLGRPVQALLYLTVVEEVDIPFDEAIADTEYWLDETELENNVDRRFMGLRLLETYPESAFPLEVLKEHGLKAAPQGPLRVKKELLDFLNTVTVNQVELGYREGKSVLREHFTRERNRKLIEAAKESFLRKEGRLFCKACKFDFEKTYGDLGDNFIEAHHTIPVSEMSEDHVSKVSDIVLLCANCHRMIHRKMPWLTVKELKEILER
ncbi:HNH endonuclease [Sporosarcina sp. Marseille-Q4943]|uniref:HNH endonuclease n=1 Tax=Sporosarcina sp. Marseille-Q4943 TaxID=2942204 RepID=UPI00208DBB7D|nr:HNH endonuclease [Sporosarcina sp. Marseille-Q4943]